MKYPIFPTITLAAASGLLVCSQVSAFTDNFNSYTTGNDIVTEPGTEWLNGTGGTTGGGVQFEGNAEESPFSGIVGGKSAKLDDSSSSRGSGAGLKYFNSGSDEATIQFDYYFSEPALGFAGFSPNLIVGDAAATGASGLYLYLAREDGESSTGYSIMSREISSFKPLAEVDEDTWYRVTVIASALTNKYDVRLQEFGGSENVIGTNENFRVGASTLSEFSFIENNGNTGTGIYTIDNVSIIPEPGAYAAIFGLSALGLVLGRRRIVRRS